jgi:hypothetical protein
VKNKGAKKKKKKDNAGRKEIGKLNLQRILEALMKMKKLERPLNYQSRQLLKKRRLESKMLKKPLKVNQRRMIQTQMIISISDRILKNLLQVKEGMSVEIILMISILVVK